MSDRCCSRRPREKERKRESASEKARSSLAGRSPAETINDAFHTSIARGRDAQLVFGRYLRNAANLHEFLSDVARTIGNIYASR